MAIAGHRAYGQGITVAGLQAEALQETLRERAASGQRLTGAQLAGLSKPLQAGIGKVTAVTESTSDRLFTDVSKTAAG